MKKILFGSIFIITILFIIPLSCNTNSETYIFKASALDAAGQCGENVYWNFDSSTGKLVISGEGAMYDYKYSDAPFCSNEIISAVVKSGVTAIGENAFNCSQKLKSIKISKTVKKIGSCAFSDCIKLTDVILNEGLKVIEPSAFSFCRNLKSISIPDSVTRIYWDAFSNCLSLKSVKLGKGLKKIEYRTFYSCGALESIVIPDNISVIEYGSFLCCDSLCEIIIPSTVTEIEDVAFDSTIVIYADKGSEAHRYAKANDLIYDLHSYKIKVTTKATSSKNGKAVETCKNCGYVKNSTVYKIKSISLSKTKYICNDKTKTPDVVVKDSNGNKLKKDTDYKVKYASGRKKVGTYKVEVTFIGKYSGSKTLYFKIVLGNVSGIKSSSQYDNGVKMAVISWNKVKGATGYQVQIYNSKSKKYENLGTGKFTVNSITSIYTDKKVTVRIRAYYSSKDGNTYSEKWTTSKITI